MAIKLIDSEEYLLFASDLIYCVNQLTPIIVENGMMLFLLFSQRVCILNQGDGRVILKENMIIMILLYTRINHPNYETFRLNLV